MPAGNQDRSPRTRKRQGIACALLAALVLACALFLGAAQGSAQDLHSKLDAKQAKLGQVRERKGVLTTTIARYGRRIDALEQQVASLRTREAAVQDALAAKEAELHRAVRALAEGRRELRSLRRHLRSAIVTLRQRLVAIYESGAPDPLLVVLESHGYNDLIGRGEYLSSIQNQDEAVIGRVTDLRNRARRTVRRLRAAKARIAAARDAIAAQQAALASAAAAVQSRQSALVGARAQRQGALGQIRGNEQELEGAISGIEDQIQAQLRASEPQPLPAGPVGAPSSSGLIWPVDGPVVSGFGWRFGGAEFHPGIDIAVQSGTPIRAAAAGTVAFTESEASSGGYGNFTCIDHGGGLATCYAHQESFAVSAGQQVEQGQVIGYSDCTGYCFGPHVHFEVRVNGTPVDPMGYL
jgi:murein DD-endopeptidase MepM/ murein hydrolase activator NlpD